MERIGGASDHGRVLARLLTCAALALVLAAPASAGAQEEQPAVPVPAAQSLMDTAHSLAVTRWGMDPCSGQVAVSWAHMGPTVNARSQWMSLNSQDPSTFSDCSITYNLDIDWDWPKLCTVIEHELGHLAGHSHTSDPHDVMSAYYVFPTAECTPPSTEGTETPPRAAATSTPKTAPQKASSKKKTTTKKLTAKQRAAKAHAAAKARTAKARAAKVRKARLARARAARLAKQRKAASRSRARFALAASSVAG